MPGEENNQKWDKTRKWRVDKLGACAKSCFEGEKKGSSFKHFALGVSLEAHKTAPKEGSLRTARLSLAVSSQAPSSLAQSIPVFSSPWQ